MENKRIPTELVNQIITSSNIVDVISEFINLAKKGNNYVGLCPFHEDSTPSFTVSPQKQIFKCFPCGASGNVVGFLQRIKNWNFIQALEFLAQRAGIQYDFSSLKNSQNVQAYSQETLELIDMLSITNSYYKVQVLTNPAAMEYLKVRKLDDATLREKFDIGYAPKNKTLEYLKSLNFDTGLMLKAGLINSDLHELFWDRVTFGIRNEFNELVGFSARSIEAHPVAKYVNSPATELFNKSKILYNFNNAKEAIASKKEVIIVEGFMDAIALYKAGFENVVALMGVALTKEHLNLIKNNKVILFLDNDAAGIDAALRTVKILFEHNFTVSLIENNYSKDADEILNTYGAETLTELIKNSQISAVNFIYEKLKQKHKVDTLKDYEAFSKFILVLKSYIDLLDIEQQKYIASLLQKEYNYTLTIKELDKVPHYDVFHNDEELVDYKHAKSYQEKVDLLTNQNRLALLIRAMSNENILELLKSTSDVALIFAKPENIKDLFEYTITLETPQDAKQIFEQISQSLNLMLNTIDTNSVANNLIIKDYIDENINEAKVTNGSSIPLMPALNEQVAEWEKFKNFVYPENGNVPVPTYIQDQISLLINYKNKRLTLKKK
ncbi:DNA primase [Mycoplasma sp. Z244B]|uniref:DNA primase n=1 Tax=Mycoplasma sp. Z244B TaxID=3401659 RepID=UPI003AAC8A83